MKNSIEHIQIFSQKITSHDLLVIEYQNIKTKACQAVDELELFIHQPLAWAKAAFKYQSLEAL